MPDAPDEIHGRLPCRMAGALVRLGTIGAVMLCAAGTFAYAGGWVPATPLAGGRPAQGRMMAASDDASAGHADCHGIQGVCGADLFESAGQATAFSSADMPVTAGMLSHVVPSVHGQWRTGIDDVARSAGNSAQNFYDRPMALAPDLAVAKPDLARMKLFLAGRPTIDRVKRPGAVATQDVPAKSGS